MKSIIFCLLVIGSIAHADKKSPAPAALPAKVSLEDKSTTEALASRVEKIDLELQTQAAIVEAAKARINLLQEKRGKFFADHQAQIKLVWDRYQLGPNDNFNFTDGLIARAPAPAVTAQAAPPQSKKK